MLIEVVLLTLIFGSLLYAALRLWLDVRKERRLRCQALASLHNSGLILTSADEQLDAPLRARLADGSIRLVSCDWLLSAEADAAFARSSSTGAAMIIRHQVGVG